MKRPSQFSLAYLLLETFWFALAFGLTRLFYLIADDHWQIRGLLLPVALILWGIAIGGLVGKMLHGALFAVAIIVVFVLVLTFFVPAVQQ